jgi:1-deoxy-D-xylulose-5-phosphate synthase
VRVHPPRPAARNRARRLGRVLEQIRGPRDLRRLDLSQLTELAAEIREFLVASVARTGGHLGPNLGAVELTLALHRVFDSPRDRILWDTGHQAYVHKIVTGRAGRFDRLRQKGGLSGYPSQAESEHDVIENSHASTALSYADGLAKAFQLRGETDRHVVAVVGDGSLTGGMAWEAINNIAADHSRRLVIVVNDNERSYAPTIGGLAHHLATLRTTRGYERFLEWGKRVLGRTPVVGQPVFEALHGVKKGIKDIVAPQGMFEDLGLKYVGPVDGHDLQEVEHALSRAKGFNGPVLVHCITRKGLGYKPAEDDVADNFHGIGVIDPETGQPLASSGPSWTGVFADELVAIGRDRPDVVGVTAAMQIPVGLDKFAAEFPERVFDVGIAEQHATTSAAGLAMGGLHPVVALYATFLNRAFDQVLMDVALHRCGVTFCLDRSGVTGPDGASHHGMWDLAVLQVVPGLRLAAPRDAVTLRALLREAVAVDDAPTVLRYPTGAVGADVVAVDSIDGVDVLRRPAGGSDADVLLVSVGAMAGISLEVAERCAQQGIGVTVVDPRWVKPVPDRVVRMAADHRCVVVVEDGVRAGGVASAVAQALRDARVPTPVRNFGIPVQFLDHGTRAEVLHDIGLTPQEIARDIVETVASLEASVEHRAPSDSPSSD